MTYSIELYFDRRFEEKLRSLWDELEKAGLPSVFSNWLPHCSISKGLSPAEALKTLEVCLYYGIKGETWVTDIGFIKFRPRKVIKTIGIADKND